MCGVVGFIDQSGETSRDELIEMGDSLSHRGPDSSGYLFRESRYSVGLGHRRLSHHWI